MGKFKNILYKVLIVLVVLIVLFLEIDRELGHINEYPTLPMKNFQCDNSYCTIEGTWDNTSYPNTSKIVCDKVSKTCIIRTSDILFNVLENNLEEFDIKMWDNNCIKAFYKNPNYLYELTINLKNEDVIYTKMPIVKEILGYKAEQSSFKLINGSEWLINQNKKDDKELKWWKTPILKGLFLIIGERS